MLFFVDKQHILLNRVITTLLCFAQNITDSLVSSRQA